MAEVKEQQNTDLIERMFTAGAHFGYSKSRRHPSMAPFIFGVKKRVEIFNLEKTNTLLLSAKDYMKKMGQEKKKVLFVGGKNEAQGAVREGAAALLMPYVAGRWIGGTLTNFSEIKKRIERLKDLLLKREKGAFEAKYTKGLTDYIVPAEIPEDIAAALKTTALAAHQVLGCRDLSRADFILDEGEEYYCL